MNPLTNRKFVGTLAALLILSTAGSLVTMFLALWQRSLGWEAVAAELLLVFVLGLEGIIAYGAFFHEETISARQRHQLTIGLLEKFTAPEAFIARAETWRLRRNWSGGDRSCVKYFVLTDGQVNSPDEEGRCVNGLTPHQNLSWLLNFYVSVQSYDEAGLLDRKLATTLLASHYQFYREFFKQFCDEYRRVAVDREVEPPWLESLPRLEALFKKSAASTAAPRDR